MSLKLDELRKRLLQQPLDNGLGPAPSSTATDEAVDEQQPEAVEKVSSKPELKAVEPARPSESTAVKTIEIGQPKERPAAAKEGNFTALLGRPNIAAVPKPDTLLNGTPVIDSVGKLFEQTKTFQVRFDELTQGLDVIERMTESTVRLFGPLRVFHGQLSQLAVSFESMRAFQSQLAELGKTFEPMKLVHDQLAQLSESIQTNLAALVKALDPAKDFRDRIMTLVRTLEQASELQADFGELYSAFRVGSAGAADSSKHERSDFGHSAAN
jgi:hypothetical protein